MGSGHQIPDFIFWFFGQILLSITWSFLIKISENFPNIVLFGRKTVKEITNRWNCCTLNFMHNAHQKKLLTIWCTHGQYELNPIFWYPKTRDRYNPHSSDMMLLDIAYTSNLQYFADYLTQPFKFWFFKIHKKLNVTFKRGHRIPGIFSMIRPD